MDHLEERIDEFFYPEVSQSSGADLEIGGHADQARTDAVVEALIDLDNLDADFGAAYRKFTFAAGTGNSDGDRLTRAILEDQGRKTRAILSGLSDEDKRMTVGDLLDREAKKI